MLEVANVTVSPRFTVLLALKAPNQRRTPVITKFWPEWVPVAAALKTAVVPLVTDAIRAPAGISPPELVTAAPTSAWVKRAVAEVMVVLVVVARSVRVRVFESHSSIPAIVQAGIPVKDIDPVLVIVPPDAVPHWLAVETRA